MSTHSHCRTNCGSTDCPAPRAAAGFQTTSASRASPQPAAQPEQPEPGALTGERIDAIWIGIARNIPLKEHDWRSVHRDFARAIEREVLATTRKRTAEQNARIMEAVRKLAVLSSDFAEGDCTGSAVDTAFAEVERLLGGEA